MILTLLIKREVMVASFFLLAAFPPVFFHENSKFWSLVAALCGFCNAMSQP